jgi:hypothetical protein
MKQPSYDLIILNKLNNFILKTFDIKNEWIKRCQRIKSAKERKEGLQKYKLQWVAGSRINKKYPY